MPKFKTLDQHIKYGGEYIEPDTEVDVPEFDVPIWDVLVDRKVAVELPSDEPEGSDEVCQTEELPSDEPEESDEVWQMGESEEGQPMPPGSDTS